MICFLEGLAIEAVRLLIGVSVIAAIGAPVYFLIRLTGRLPPKVRENVLAWLAIATVLVVFGVATYDDGKQACAHGFINTLKGTYER